MRKKIQNPYPDNNCFFCGRDNSAGLKRDASNHDQVTLTVSTMSPIEYTLVVDGVEDLYANAMEKIRTRRMGRQASAITEGVMRTRRKNNSSSKITLRERGASDADAIKKTR